MRDKQNQFSGKPATQIFTYYRNGDMRAEETVCSIGEIAELEWGETVRGREYPLNKVLKHLK